MTRKTHQCLNHGSCTVHDCIINLKWALTTCEHQRIIIVRVPSCCASLCVKWIQMQSPQGLWESQCVFMTPAVINCHISLCACLSEYSRLGSSTRCVSISCCDSVHTDTQNSHWLKVHEFILKSVTSENIRLQVSRRLSQSDALAIWLVYSIK